METPMRKTLSFLLLAIPLLCQAASVDSKNWMNHPEIRKIRSLYNDIEASIRTEKLKKTTLPPGCKNPVHPEWDPDIAALYEESSGVVRKLAISGGTDDFAADANYYYDKGGKLRFFFQSLRDVNGTEQESRIYYRENGEVLYQDGRLIKGPGRPGGFDEFITDPREAFKSLCQ
jgi:hypothetical protein